MDYGPDGFPFAVGLQNSAGFFFINQSQYRVRAFLQLAKKTIDMAPSSPTNFKPTYDPANEGTLWCFNENQSVVSSFSLYRGETLNVIFETCLNNGTNGCATSSELSAMLKGSRLKMVFKDYFFDAENYENPLNEDSNFFNPSITTTVSK